jgi:uncharacterized DUF497 family protein
MFSWDERKNRANRKKHGVSFDLALEVFDDPFQLSTLERIENGEERWQTIGMVDDTMLLLVVHLWEDLETGEEHIRIISARRATAHERARYEKRR